MPRKTREELLKEHAEINRQQDLAMMQNPKKWPNWPILPLKKRKLDGSFPDPGLLVEVAGAVKPIVIKANMWQIAEKGSPPLSTYEKQEYSSFEALVDDGWMVD